MGGLDTSGSDFDPEAQTEGLITSIAELDRVQFVERQVIRHLHNSNLEHRGPLQQIRQSNRPNRLRKSTDSDCPGIRP